MWMVTPSWWATTSLWQKNLNSKGDILKENILKKIKSDYATFSKSQRLIADFVLNNFAEASVMTASKLAETVKVSESTVVRFATELGYLGYPEFIAELTEYVRSESNLIKRTESLLALVKDEDVLKTVMNSDSDNIKLTLQNINKDQFDGAADAILNANKIYIVGVRSSACLASFAEFYFSMLFDNVYLLQANSVSDIFELVIRADEKSVVLGISFPRYSKRTVKAMSIAKSKGAKLIALTDSEKSPIAKDADYLITAKSEMVSFVDSLVAPFSVLNALIVKLVLKKKDEVLHTFEELENIWEEYEVYDKYNKL